VICVVGFVAFMGVLSFVLLRKRLAAKHGQAEEVQQRRSSLIKLATLSTIRVDENREEEQVSQLSARRRSPRVAEASE
jgi:hypothetical protein